jgi:hypothetical protein
MLCAMTDPRERAGKRSPNRRYGNVTRKQRKSDKRPPAKKPAQLEPGRELKR